jgi:hypothetical protein
MESKKINQLATELAPDLSDLTIIGDPTTGISKKITLSQMASLFTGTVEEYANLAAFPLVGVADTIYIALDTNVLYRYDTSLSAYVILSPNIINSLVFSDANGFDGTITLVGSVATLSITTALTLGSVPFIGASGALTQDNSNLFFDDTNNRLGIATASPTTPLDVFGSGIIGRLNATSTNNAYLGFASNGTNKWSAGNVQSDHRFRIFSEANSAELITILQTGEFGIGIANPLTKFHIDGGATALIANLDANVSVAKSISFRSDNSNRINLEVSGTESGSNAGADFFLRTFTDAGSLIETPLSIVRSTGVTTIKSLTLTNVLSVANGGTGSATQNFVDLTTAQSIGGLKTFTSTTAGTSAIFNANVGIGVTPSSQAFSGVQSLQIMNALYFGYLNRANVLANASITSGGALNYIATDFATRYEQFDGKHQFSTAPSGTAATAITFTPRLLIDNAGVATFSSANSIIANTQCIRAYSTNSQAADLGGGISFGGYYVGTTTTADFANIKAGKDNSTSGNYAGYLAFSTNAQATGNVERMRITSSGWSKFSNTGTYSSPNGEFHQFNSNDVDDVTLQVYASSTSKTGNVLEAICARAAANTYSLFACYSGSSSVQFFIRGDGLIVGPGLISTHTTGSAANLYADPANGAIYRSTSSIKYKKNVEDYSKGLDIVMQLRPVTYEGKNEIDEGKIFAGFIAEEIHDIGLTEYIQYAEDGTPDALAYQNMVALLTKAIQELKAEVDALKSK